jgi:Flp pilus assembly protein TadG
MSYRPPSPTRQRGAIVPLVAAALVVLLGAMALALDVGNAFRNKALLQNALDAAALSGAKVLNTTGDVLAAEQEARAMIGANAQVSHGKVLSDQVADGTVTIAVEFSNTLHPFAPGTTPAQYIRVKAQDLSLPNYFAGVVGLNTFALAGTAVAGPSPVLSQTCDVVPMMACGEGSGPWYGYTPGQIVQLKSAAGSDSEVGPGIFQLIRLGDSTGADDLRNAMAGNYENCMETGKSQEIETEPGNTVGPAAQGINTRLGVYNGPLADQQDRYPPDLVTTHPGYRYADYVSDYQAQTYTNPDGAWDRRILTIPFGNCSGTASGQTSIPLLGFGCFFLLDRASQKGNEAVIEGEFIDDCAAHGVPGPNPGAGVGPYTIELYEDPDSLDS